jgi:hypothetical protein
MSDYYCDCECCGKECHITGAYLGTFEEVYCEECGFHGDNCGLECEKEEVE